MESSRYILGISAFYHDSATALMRDGEIVAAAQEERFTRRKGDADFPERAVAFCLSWRRTSRSQPGGSSSSAWRARYG